MRDYNTFLYKILENEEAFRRASVDFDGMSGSDQTKAHFQEPGRGNLGIHVQLECRSSAVHFREATMRAARMGEVIDDPRERLLRMGLSRCCYVAAGTPGRRA